MSDQTYELIRDLLPLVGVTVGVVMTAWVGAGNEAKRWRRDFTLEVFREQREFVGEVMVNVNNQHILLQHICSILRGQGGPADAVTRLGSAVDDWRRLLALSGVMAQPDVQTAMVAFDVARADVNEAINAKDLPAMDGLLTKIDTARLELVEQINTYFHASGRLVARHVLPARTRLWRRLRGESTDYF